MNRIKRPLIFIMILFFTAISIYRFFVSPLISGRAVDYALGWSAGRLGSLEGTYDVIIAGGQPDGIAAAVTAARSGAGTLLLIEGSRPELELSPGEKAFTMETIGSRIPCAFLSELKARLGKSFSTDKYLMEVEKILKREKNLEVAYRTGIIEAITEEKKIIGLKILEDAEVETVMGRRIIDATGRGNVLSLCGVPSTEASIEKLGIKVKQFKGEYVLQPEDILNGRIFKDTVVMSCETVKAAGRGGFETYKTLTYGIPIRCLLPAEIENLIMTGPKISYLPIAAVSAGKPWISIAAGEAAGTLSVYSLVRGITIRQLAADKGGSLKELQKILKRQGIPLKHGLYSFKR